MTANSDKTIYTRIETVEREAWFDMFAGAPDEYAERSKLSYERFGTSIGLADPSLPIAEFNRAMSLGIEEPITEERLNQTMAWMNAHAIPNYSLQVAPTALPDSHEGLLEAKGFEKSSGWAKFYRDGSLPEPHRLATTLEVRLVEAHHAEDFSRSVQMGFGLPESIVPFKSALAARPNWKVYAAYDGELPVACGAMYVKDGWAWLGIDATLADHRGKGAQYALIHKRLTDGIAAGVTGFTAETGQPPHGQESTNKSYCNYLRAGFKPMYVRPNYFLKK